MKISERNIPFCYNGYRYHIHIGYRDVPVHHIYICKTSSNFYFCRDEEDDDKSKKEATKEAEAKIRGRRSIPDGRWQHDLYKEDEQRAKSAQELIDIYGYDIRNEESAPKARRRRKYGLV